MPAPPLKERGLHRAKHWPRRRKGEEEQEEGRREEARGGEKATTCPDIMPRAGWPEAEHQIHAPWFKNQSSHSATYRQKGTGCPRELRMATIDCVGWKRSETAEPPATDHAREASRRPAQNRHGKARRYNALETKSKRNNKRKRNGGGTEEGEEGARGGRGDEQEGRWWMRMGSKERR